MSERLHLRSRYMFSPFSALATHHEDLGEQYNLRATRYLWRSTLCSFILRPKGVNLLLLWIFTAELSDTDFKQTQILKYEWEPRPKVKFFSWHRVSLSRLVLNKGPCATSTLEKNKIGSKTDPKRALFSVSPRVYIYFPTSTSHSLSSVRLNYSGNILQMKDRKSVIA